VARTDGIVPALLEQGVDHLATHPRHIFLASLAGRYISKLGARLRWCLSPNPRRPTIPRLWRIDLIIYDLSYWKDVKLVHRHIRDKSLGLCPLHWYQFAYQPWKSPETALHHGTSIETALENRDVILGALLDIEGAFENTSLYIIRKAVKRHGLGNTICRWIGSMLGGKKNHIQLHRRNSGGFCGQGSALAPLLWSLVVDEFRGLSYTRGCRWHWSPY